MAMQRQKVVLVTGCSNGGIGFALCEEYAVQGCKVYATARRLEAMDGFRHEYTSGGIVKKLVLDVTKDGDVENAVATIIEREGRIDVLVNNAGVLCVGPVIDVSMDTVRKTYDANVFSVIRMCKAVIPHMAARKSGTIVNISSIGAYFPTPWAGIYASTKAAMHSLNDALYMECFPLNISVVLVATGGIRSNLSANHASVFPGLPESSLYKRYLTDITARIHMSQTGAMPAEEYARLVVGKTLRERPPRYMRLGTNSLLFTVLLWIPRSVALWLFWRALTKHARSQGH